MLESLDESTVVENKSWASEAISTLAVRDAID